MAVSSIAMVAVVVAICAQQIGEYKDTIADMNKTIGSQQQTIDMLVQGMYEGTFLHQILERAIYVEQGDEVLVYLVISKDDLEALRAHGIDIVPAGNITTTELHKV